MDLDLTLGHSLFSCNPDNYLMTLIRIIGIINKSSRYRKVSQLVQGYTALRTRCDETDPQVCLATEPVSYP